MYRIKTRNWNCKRWVLRLLQVSHIWGATRGDSYNDGDGKFWLETKSPVLAWATWLLYMMLRRWSGGWTYIIRPKGCLTGGDYKAIY